MARMHLAGADFALSRANALSVAGWRPLLEACAPRADTVKPGLASTLAAELDHLESRWPKDLPAGVIHADLFPDNVFFRPERLPGDRKSVVSGKSVSVRVDLGGRRIIQKKKTYTMSI